MDKLDQQQSEASEKLEKDLIAASEDTTVCNVTLPEDVHLIERGGQQYAGRHYILDFWGMNNLCDVNFIENALRDASDTAKATLLHIHLHEFSGGGVTGVALLAESHISIHTWPEYDYAAFDIFMCGQSEAENAVDLLTSAFSPNKHDIKELLRGKIDQTSTIR